MGKTRIRSLSVGADEHKRIKIMSAREDVTMTDLVNRLINYQWDKLHEKERNEHASNKTEKVKV